MLYGSITLEAATKNRMEVDRLTRSDWKPGQADRDDSTVITLTLSRTHPLLDPRIILSLDCKSRTEGGREITETSSVKSV